MELVADSEVVLHGVYDLLESIIVPVDLQGVSDDRLNPIVVAHDFYRADNAELWDVLTTR